MALHFLSGDAEMNGKKSKAKKSTKKEAKKTKKASKPKVKKVAKVGLAPSRAAFLATIELNLLKIATKLARVWNKPGGKERLTKFWLNFGGDPEKLKAAIQKGSKQTISGSEMGAVGATTAALAAPIIVAVAKIVSEFKAGGDDKEKKDFDSGVNQALNYLKNNPDANVTDQSMPDRADTALIKPKGDGTTNASLGTNPATICFLICLMIPLIIQQHNISNPVLLFIASFIMLYGMIGWLFIPGYVGSFSGWYKNLSKTYFDVPAKWFYSLTNIFSHAKA